MLILCASISLEINLVVKANGNWNILFFRYPLVFVSCSCYIVFKKEVGMSKSAIIRAQIDPALKEEVEMILQELGLSTTQAITLFYQQIRLLKDLPFEAHVPNEVTLRTFMDTDAGRNVICCENAQELFDRLGM
jgi:DNA-damage-inducible protein J